MSDAGLARSRRPVRRRRLRRHRAVRRGQGNADPGPARARPGAGGGRLGDHAPAAAGEIDGREYWFLCPTRSSRAGSTPDEFLEHVPYVSGRRYGTLRSEIDRIAEEGRVCVLELELEGALRVQDEVPGSVTIFIAADVPELERRLRDRATESTGEIGERIELAREQLEQAHRFRYMVRNDDLERATTALAAVVDCELAFAGTMARP